MSKGAGLVRTKKEKKGGTHSGRGLGGKTTERRKKCKKETWHRFAMCQKLKGVGSDSESFRTCGAR